MGSIDTPDKLVCSTCGVYAQPTWLGWVAFDPPQCGDCHKKECRQLLHVWLLEEGPFERVGSMIREAMDGTGMTDAEVRNAYLALLSNGAVGETSDTVFAREEVDPLSREDHVDCWPVCDHFHDEDKARGRR